jgi:hypothetical protein
MKQIKAVATLDAKIFFSRFESITPGYSREWTEEWPDDTPDEVLLERQDYLTNLMRERVEDKLDEDISDVKEMEFYKILRYRGEQLKEILPRLPKIKED